MRRKQIEKYPQVELNHHLPLRRRLFYPLNYEDILVLDENLQFKILIYKVGMIAFAVLWRPMSGIQDSNLQPLRPERSALANYANPRKPLFSFLSCYVDILPFKEL